MNTPRRAMMMAMDRNKLIGKAGGLPWHISEDLKRFRALTTGKAIIMGRRTFSDDIQRPLPKRTNIVVTRDLQWHADGVEIVHGLDAAYARADALHPDAEEHVVIGGAQLCSQAIAMTNRLYLTVVDAVYDGDTWFDSFDMADWQVVAEEKLTTQDTGASDAVDVSVIFYTLDKA